VAHEVGHDLQATGDFGQEIAGKVDEFIEHATDPDPNGNARFPRFDVDVTGSRTDGIDEDAVHESNNIDVLVGRTGLEESKRFAHSRSGEQLEKKAKCSSDNPTGPGRGEGQG
jgi:hypothetical protein